jgi:hypothetical protein
MQRRTLRRLIALTVSVGALGAAPAADAATTKTVGTPSATCTPNAGLTTIQQGVNASAPGDTIRVCPGTYPESVNVDKANLTFQGAQSGNDARPRSSNPDPATDSVVNPPESGNPAASAPAFNVNANGVTIDGFAVTGSTGVAGIALSASTPTGAHIIDNLVRGNTIGLSLAGTNNVVSNNAIVDNNVGGPASGSGIYGDTTISSSTISNNAFRDNDNSGVILPDTTVKTGVTIDGNSVVNGHDNNGATGFYLQNVRGSSTVQNNNIGPLGGAGMFVAGSQNLTIQRNNIHNVGFSAVRLAGPGDGNDTGGFQVNSELQITGNTLANNGDYAIKATNGAITQTQAHFNRIVENSQGGILNESQNPELNAENNFFGCNTGPTTSNGACNSVSSNVDADPYLVLRVTANPTTVTVPGSSTITASFLTNSDGQPAAGATAFPTTRVSFQKIDPNNGGNVGPGSLSNGSATTSNGQASVALTSSDVGTTTVEGRVDSASATAAVKFVAKPARDCNALVAANKKAETTQSHNDRNAERRLHSRNRAAEAKLARDHRARERRLHGSARTRQISRDRAAEKRLADRDRAAEARLAKRDRTAEQAKKDRDRQAEQDCFNGK